MKTLTQKREEFLLDTLEYYTADVNRRCVGVGGHGCQYDPKNADKIGISKGCAIGRHMTLRNKTIADEYGNINSVPRNLIPTKLLDLEMRFLMEIQKLHDIRQYWDNVSLTENGKDKVNMIVKLFFLNSNRFTDYVN